jgi:hypothetical protein
MPAIRVSGASVSATATGAGGAGAPAAATLTTSAAERAAPARSAFKRTSPACGKLIVAVPSGAATSMPGPTMRASLAGDGLPARSYSTTESVAGSPTRAVAGARSSSGTTGSFAHELVLESNSQRATR